MNTLALLVEDDLDLATTIIDYLQLDQIECDHAANGFACLELMKKNDYDVIMLDVNMPRMDGLTLCKKLRGDGVDTSILMLTARDTLEDKLTGFHSGADDYMVKPFELQELVARVQVLSKRRSGQQKSMCLEGLKVDFSQKLAQRNQRQLQLSPTGWILLETLMRKSPEIVTRDKLSQAVWGDALPDSNSLKVHLFRLRQQVDFKGEVKLVQTITGQGIALRKSVDQ
jgi:DNA-binding response OmpR family regulator